MTDFGRDVDIGAVIPDMTSRQYSRAITQLVGSGAGEAVNLCRVSGAVKVLSLHGVFTSVTDVSAVTAAYLDLYDDDAKTITGVAGTDLSGVSVGSVIGKNGIKTALLALWDSADGVVVDGVEGTDWMAPFIVVPQAGTDTYIRFVFASDSGGYNFTIQWEIVWQPLFSGGSLIP